MSVTKGCSGGCQCQDVAEDSAAGPGFAPGFQIKDSGERAQFDSGMVRDTEEDKIDYTLVFDGPMFKRWAGHLTKGAKKYAPRNWMKATGQEEHDRFKRSLLRHLVAYLDGETDEDHAAAILFNVNGMEYVRERQQWEGEEFEIALRHFKDPRQCPESTQQ